VSVFGGQWTLDTQPTVSHPADDLTLSVSGGHHFRCFLPSFMPESDCLWWSSFQLFLTRFMPESDWRWWASFQLFLTRFMPESDWRWWVSFQLFLTLLHA